MKYIVSIMCGVLASITFPVLASAQPAHAANSPKAELHLSQPLAVGSYGLQPGDYKFQCKRIDGQDFLIVTSSDDGREVARVPCRPEELTKKVEITEFRSVARPDGTQALSAVRIRGEMLAHRVVTN